MFETHLRELMSTDDIRIQEFENITFLPRHCMLCIDKTLRAKIQFETDNIANQYPIIAVKIINRTEGIIDQIHLHINDILPTYAANNHNIRPHIWISNDKAAWYGHKPSPQELSAIRTTILEYINMFR